MHLLYLDESGSGNHTTFVLGGVSVHENNIQTVTTSVDAIVSNYFPENPNQELHVAALRSLAWKDDNKGFDKNKFWAMMEEVGNFIRTSRDNMTLLASVIHKPSLDRGNDPYVAAFEGMAQRMNAYLHHNRRENQKGMLILDRSSDRRSEQMREVFSAFRSQGTRWGSSLSNIAEVPMFAHSHATRLIQLADYISHYVFRRYEFKHAKIFDLILPAFDQRNDVLHGIGHLISKKENCMCAPCVSRKKK